jgi:triacylglycerol esterase/lipase EstA (alpha/beta hydrolase family)
VHVFVHGIGNRNDSYAKGQTPMLGTWFYGSTVDRISNLYTNNYRGAFVNVDPEGTIQNNANLLNTQLQRITTYFGVSSVVMVGMSKGGLDIQGAMYYHGAQSMINYVITLGTPHWGSPLASLVCDNAQTLQSMKNFARSDAVKDLRQESVINFRYNFDNNPNMIATPFFTIGATGTCAATSFFNRYRKTFHELFRRKR